jgi:ribonuclease BN (tRNA processing enzyme)
MDGLSLRFLGCGDAFGSGGRLQTCMLVDAPALRFLIDCGASSMIALRRWQVDPNSIELILLTHLHGDHFGGLPFLLLDAQLISKRTQPLTIAGPPGTEQRVREAQEVLFPGSSHSRRVFPVRYVEWSDGQAMAFDRLVVTPFEVVHASGAPPYALRIECQDKVIAYSGDSEWTDALIRVARGADLFVCEAYYFEKRVRYHLDYQTLMEQRAALGCKRLVLTHLQADLLDRAGPLAAECAADGLRIEV